MPVPSRLDVLNTIHSIGAGGTPTARHWRGSSSSAGWAIVAKPLYLALRFLHGLMGVGAYNWGWAIIAFTVSSTC